MKHNINPIPIHFLLLSIFLCSSCQSYLQLSELQPNKKEKLNLPPLVIDYEWESQPHSFPLSREIDIVSSDDLYSDEIQYTSRTDVRIQDIKTLMRREIQQNILQGGSPDYGTAVCRIVGKNSYRDLNFFIGLSAVGMFVPTIFGLPLGRQNTEVALEIEIKDGLGQSIGIYEGIGISRMVQGIYYGHQANRKTNIEATKMALNLIQEQIKHDSEHLTTALLANGPH